MLSRRERRSSVSVESVPYSNDEGQSILVVVVVDDDVVVGGLNEVVVVGRVVGTVVGAVVGTVVGENMVVVVELVEVMVEGKYGVVVVETNPNVSLTCSR